MRERWGRRDVVLRAGVQKCTRGGTFWSSDSKSEAHGCRGEELPWSFDQSDRRWVGQSFPVLHATVRTLIHRLKMAQAWREKQKKRAREQERLADTEKASRPLCAWINLRISMDDRSDGSPSTVKHPGGCALIVLLTLIVIKGLKTACRLWVTSRAKVANHLFIGDITALSNANMPVAVKSDRSAEWDGFIWSRLPF